jgi:hypothetical protein
MNLTALNSVRRFFGRVAAHPASVAVARIPVREKVVIVTASAMVATLAVTIPLPPTQAEQLADYIDANAQTVAVPMLTSALDVSRADYTATPGVATLIAGGTNHDWAQLVLLYGGWPQTESNITVITRWMRQENGPDNWWNRNNPLNNGWGSGGGGGTGRYANLDIAAQKCAEALTRHPGYAGIVAAFESGSTPTATIESAIWASPWASGHYADGGHWSYRDVPVVKAPASAWG